MSRRALRVFRSKIRLFRLILCLASASLLSGGSYPFSNHLEQYSDVNLFLLPMTDSLLGKTGKISF